MSDLPKPLLSIKTISERYDIKENTVRKMIQRGEIGYAKKDPDSNKGMIRVPECEVDRLFTYFPPVQDVVNNL